ncbi:MAG: HAD-IA family hydrolase [Eubacterium sp.]|nr:HAD-IA family hydrolase [Eubacterium sp.]
MMKKAVIFDLDDTLYDYDSINKKALDIVFENTGKEFSCTVQKVADAFEIARKEVKECLGQTAAAHNRMLYFQRTLEHLRQNPLLYSEEMYNLYWDYMLQHMELNDGVIDVLEYCRKMGIKVGICTDLTAHIQHRKLKRLGIASYISALVTSEEAGSEKPNQAIFRMILAKLCVKPDEALYVGDSLEKDIIGAQNAGMDAVWFSSVFEGGVKTITRINEVKEMLHED